MGRTYTVMSPDGQDMVQVVFSDPVLETRVRVTHISDFNRDTVSREIFQVIRELKDSGLVREIVWDPEALKMYLHGGKRRGWLINRLESILGPVAQQARVAEHADH